MLLVYAVQMRFQHSFKTVCASPSAYVTSTMTAITSWLDFDFNFDFDLKSCQERFPAPEEARHHSTVSVT